MTRRISIPLYLAAVFVFAVLLLGYSVVGQHSNVQHAIELLSR